MENTRRYARRTGVARYLVTITLLTIVASTVQGLIGGAGLVPAVVGGFVGLLWVGWFIPLAGIPICLVVLLLIPRAAGRTSMSIVIVAATVSALVWVAFAVGIAGVLALFGSNARDTPLTLVSAATTLLGVGLVGTLIGLVEGWARRST